MERGIRKASMEDIGHIMTLIAECVRVMKEGGSDQWDETYPNAEVIGRDIERGTLYVCEEEGEVAGILVLDENQDEQYRKIEWSRTEGYLVMHRLAVHPEVQGKGIARRLIAFAEHFAAEQGYTSIRMDTYAKNTKALDLYRRLGYERRGEISLPGRTANFPVMEKILLPARPPIQ